MKGTRLWKPAGSPLIQGRSRRERAFGVDVAAAVVASIAATFAVGVGVMYLRGATFDAAVGALWLPALVSGCVSAPFGVWMATRFGWHPRWIGGSVVGTMVGLLGCWWYVATLS